jgi:hypothetical protein
MSWQSGLSQVEQIGNAVPPRLAAALGKSILKVLTLDTSVASAAAKSELFQQSELFSAPDLPKTQTGGKRGRKSRYEEIYCAIEAAPPGSPVPLPQDLPHEFYVFLTGAMTRRQIRYEIQRSSSRNVSLVKLT